MTSKFTYTVENYLSSLETKHSCGDRTPYTYLIGWSKLDRWYYGCRYGKNCHPNDLWRAYFTSSKHVKKFREEHGEPDVIQIRRVFDDIQKCCLWENKTLKRLKVSRKENWLNVSHGYGPYAVSGGIWISGRFYESSEYKSTPDIKYHTRNKRVVTYDGINFHSLEINHHDIITGKAYGYNKGKRCIHFDDNKFIFQNVSDPVPVGGITANSGKTIVKTSITTSSPGKIMSVYTNDIRLSTGELVGLHCDETLYHIILPNGLIKSTYNLRMWCIQTFDKKWKSAWSLFHKRGSYGKWKSNIGRYYIIKNTLGM